MANTIDNHPFPHNDADLFEPGTILADRYRVQSVLGRGGMGAVYVVEQIFLGKELALKSISKGLFSDSTARRFRTEARAAFAVDHPNVVAVYEFGLLEEKYPFLAMELVKGETLASLIARGGLNEEKFLSLFIQICFGLAHAHDLGIVHRDVKPSNIMIVDGAKLGSEGSVKILDFGIAKILQHEEGEIQALTKTGEIFGSPLYMSPEQCLGHLVDHRSDIYSLGCVMFECLTGKPPFHGDSALSTMLLHQSAVAPKVRIDSPQAKNISPELENIVAKMLSKEPNDRYQNLGVLALELADIQKKVSTEAPLVAANLSAVSSALDTKIILSKQKMLAWVLSLSLVAFVAGFALTYVIESSQQHKSTTR